MKFAGPIESSCSDAGGHFYYGDAIHGEFTASPPDRHEGQLGNIYMENSETGAVNTFDKVLNIIPGMSHTVFD